MTQELALDKKRAVILHEQVSQEKTALQSQLDAATEALASRMGERISAWQKIVYAVLVCVHV